MSSNKAEKQSHLEVLAGVMQRLAESHVAESVPMQARRKPAAAVKEVATIWR
jgi:hypothetical protein